MSRLRRRRYVRRDGGGLAPVVSLTTITGYWCPACGLPRVPYRGDGGVHPLCYRRTPTDTEETR